MKWLVLLLVLVLVACVPGTPKAPPTQVYEGSDGIVVSFFPNAPPDNAFPGSTIGVGVLFENKGAVDVNCEEECGHFLVFARAPILDSAGGPFAVKDSLKDALENSLETELSGKESYLSGGKAALELPVVSVAEVESSTTANIFALACYPYRTLLSTAICVDTAPLTLDPADRVCDLKDISLKNQGAPVAITKVSQARYVKNISGRNIVHPLVRLTLANVGGGLVLDNSSTSLSVACTADAEASELPQGIIGLVSVSADVSGIPMRCNGGRPFKLSGDRTKDVVECVADFEAMDPSEFNAIAPRFDYRSNDNSFVTTLNVQLTYGYQTSVAKEVEIEVLHEHDDIPGFGGIEQPCNRDGSCDEPWLYCKKVSEPGVCVLESEKSCGSLNQECCPGVKKCDDPKHVCVDSGLSTRCVDEETAKQYN